MRTWRPNRRLSPPRSRVGHLARPHRGDPPRSFLPRTPAIRVWQCSARNRPDPHSIKAQAHFYGVPTDTSTSWWCATFLLTLAYPLGLCIRRTAVCASGYTNMAHHDDLLTATAASRLADISVVYLRQLANAGKIPVLRTTTGTRLFRRGDIDTWLAERKANPPVRGPRPKAEKAGRQPRPAKSSKGSTKTHQ